MNTVTRDFINRRPEVEIEPDAEYTCQNCHRRSKVSESGPRKAGGFVNRVEVICPGCGRWVVLVPSF